VAGLTTVVAEIITVVAVCHCELAYG